MSANIKEVEFELKTTFWNACEKGNFTEAKNIYDNAPEVEVGYFKVFNPELIDANGMNIYHYIDTSIKKINDEHANQNLLAFTNRERMVNLEQQYKDGMKLQELLRSEYNKNLEVNITKSPSSSFFFSNNRGSGYHLNGVVFTQRSTWLFNNCCDDIHSIESDKGKDGRGKVKRKEINSKPYLDPGLTL